MRHATVRTDHTDAATARSVAAAIRPDNTDEMDTQADGASITTTVRRETTGGLHSTLDDYVVNLQVATRLLDSDDTQQDLHTDITGTDTETATETATDAEPTTDTTTDT